MTDLSHEQKMRILREVILGGGQKPAQESPEEAAWRKVCEKDVADCYAKGLTPEMPWDSHDPD